MSLSKFALVAMFALMTGCATQAPKKTDIDKVIVMPTYGDMVAIPKAAPTNLKKLEFKVMTRVELAKYEKLHTNEAFVLYSLDDGNLQVLTGNLDELHRYIKEQQAVIDYLTGLINLRREEKEPTK